MASRVDVTFGANVQDLIDGVDRVRSSIDRLGERLTHLAEMFGVAFTVEGVKHFVESMAELGLNTERTAATLGISNEKVVELSGIAKMTGTSMDDLATGIERMSLNIQKSTRDGTNPAAEGLKVLGLNARELIGLPTDQYFLKLADAVSKFNPSLNLTNAVMAVGGRGVASMMPLLLQGREHVEEFEQAWQKASEGLAAAVPAMANTHEKLTLLGEATQSLGARIFSALKPAIDAAITAVTNWVESIRADDIRAAITEIGDVTITVLQTVSEFFVQAAAEFDTFAAKIGGFDLRRAALNVLDPNLGDLLLGKDKELDTQLGKIQDTANSRLGVIREWAAQYRDALASAVPSPGSAAAMAQDFLSVQQGALSALESYTKQNAAAINIAAKDQLGAVIASINAQVQAQDAYYQQQVEHINSLARLFQITEQQKTQMLLQALNERQAMQTAELQQALSLQGLTLQQAQKLQDELTKITQKGAADQQKINDQAVEDYQRQWESALGTIEGAFNSQLRGLLAGTTSWSQAFKSILGDLVIKFIEFCEQKVAKWIATEMAQTTATTAGAAARTAADQSAANAGLLANAAKAMEQIMQDAAQTFGGVFAFLAPVMGPAAAGPAEAAAASVSAAAIFDVGTNYVVRGGLALIHPGETIIPAAQGSGPYTGGPVGGTVNAPVNLNISAMDARSISRFFNDNAHHMIRAISRGMKNGAHLGLSQR